MSRRRRAEVGAEAQAEGAAPGLTFLPFQSIPLSNRSQLGVDLVDGPSRRSVSMRLTSSAGDGRPPRVGRPIHLFPDQLPAVIAALTGAAAAIGALPADWPTLPHSAPVSTRWRPDRPGSA